MGKDGHCPLIKGFDAFDYRSLCNTIILEVSWRELVGV